MRDATGIWAASVRPGAATGCAPRSPMTMQAESMSFAPIRVSLEAAKAKRLQAYRRNR